MEEEATGDVAYLRGVLRDMFLERASSIYVWLNGKTNIWMMAMMITIMMMGLRKQSEKRALL